MKPFRINLYNRDGAQLSLVSKNGAVWHFDVDDKHKYVLKYMRIGYLEDNKTIEFVDPSGGPLLKVGHSIDNEYVLKLITYLDDDMPSLILGKC